MSQVDDEVTSVPGHRFDSDGSGLRYGRIGGRDALVAEGIRVGQESGGAFPDCLTHSLGSDQAVGRSACLTVGGDGHGARLWLPGRHAHHFDAAVVGQVVQGVDLVLDFRLVRQQAVQLQVWCLRPHAARARDHLVR